MSALCLPHAWLAFFDDLPLVAVLAAHASAPCTPEDYVDLSEWACVERTRLNRETVRKKKHELIERYRVLCLQPGAGRRGKPLLCRLDRERLSQLVENRPQVGGIPPSELAENRQVVGGKPPSELAENRQVVGGKPPGSAAASLLPLVVSSELTGERPEENALEEALLEAIGRSRLTTLGGEKLDDWTVGNMVSELRRIAPDEIQVKAVIEVVEAKCRDWAKRPPAPASAENSWGYLVGIVKRQVRMRKPPGKEESVDPYGYNAQLRTLGVSKDIQRAFGASKGSAR